MDLYEKIERTGAALLLIVFCVYSFIYVNEQNALMAASGGRFSILETRWDPYIPFAPYFVFAYYLYYPWVLLPIPILKERQVFYHTVFAFGLLQTSAIAAFLAVPSRMARPLVTGDGIAIRMVQAMYHADPGFNLLPSLHVAHSTLVALVFFRYGRKYFPIVAAGTAMISISTVFIKQHYVIDIPAGLAFAGLAFVLSDPGMWKEWASKVSMPFSGR
jgi:hypothetical protein